MAKSGKNNRGWLRLVILLGLTFGILLILGAQNLSQTVLNMSYARAYALAVDTVNRAVQKVLSDGVAYEDLVEVQLDAEQHVAMLRANTVRMNDIATRTALMAEEELNNVRNQEISIPLGSVLGIKFLAGAGQHIKVQLLPVGAVKTSFDTEFESAGINQTRHKIFLTVRSTVSLILPTGSQKVEVLSTIPIAESIIVGHVPDSFVDVSDQDDMLNLIP